MTTPAQPTPIDQNMLALQSQQAMTMVMSTIMMSVQNNLVSQIKTGYPLADTLLSTGVICTIGYGLLGFQQHGPKWAGGMFGTVFSQVREYLYPAPIEHVVRVGEVDDTASYHNVYFQAFIWYLGKQQAQCDKGRMRLFAGAQQPTDRVMPESGLPCEIKHNDKIITYTIGADSRWRYVNFSVRDTNAATILDFLRTMKSEFIATQVAAPTTKEWQQRRYENRGNNWDCVGYTYNTKTFETVVLDADDKEDLETLVNSFLNGEQWCKSMGVSWQDGVLLSGSPGMGKTSLIKAISYKMRRDVYVLDLSTVKDNDQLRALFQNLPSAAFVVLEDVDCMTDAVHNRDDSDYRARMEGQRLLRERVVVARALGTAVRRTADAAAQDNNASRQSMDGRVQDDVDAMGISTGITLDCLLNLLDGLSSCHGLFIVMTTNHPERLDPALIRAGRCNLHIRLRACTAKQVDDFFGLFYNKPEQPQEHIPSEILETIPDRVLPPAEVFGFFRRHMYNRRRALEKMPEFIVEQIEKVRLVEERAVKTTHHSFVIEAETLRGPSDALREFASFPPPPPMNMTYASPALTADPGPAPVSPVRGDILTDITQLAASAASIAAKRRNASKSDTDTPRSAKLSIPPPPPLVKPWKLPTAERRVLANTPPLSRCLSDGISP